MFKIECRTPEIQEKSIQGDSIILVADVPQVVKLFQGQRLKVKTGIAINTDNHAFAVALRGRNSEGLVLACGMELVSDQEGEIEILLWNRNAPGTPRMIEIIPQMPVAQLLIMPSVGVELPKVEATETETVPQTEKSLEEQSVKDLRLVIDGLNNGREEGEIISYLKKTTKPELIALIRGQGDNGSE